MATFEKLVLRALWVLLRDIFAGSDHEEVVTLILDIGVELEGPIRGFGLPK